MGKKAKRIGVGVGTLGGSEATRALSKSTGVIDPFGIGMDMLFPDKPKKPGDMPRDTTEQSIAAARSTEIEERKKRRVSLITSPGGAFLKATDLSKPTLTLGS